MIKKLKNYTFCTMLLFSTVVSAQLNSNTAKQYPSLYENSAISTSVVHVEKEILSPKELIDIKINSMMSDPVLKNAHWGFVVYDPKTKKVVSSYNEDVDFIPASTTKLLTTETAIYHLGEKFRWNTQLEYSGIINEEGILNGNLYVVGSGDPSIGTGKAGASTNASVVQNFVEAIKELGIKKIEGDILVQTAIFKENRRPILPENIVWLEHHNYYLPVGSTVNIDPKKEKIIAKKFNPFEENTKRYFYISPYIKKMVYADSFDGETIATKVPDAPISLSTILRNSLIKNGVHVVGKVQSKLIDTNPELRNFITTYKSPTLSEIIYFINQRSDNGLSESLLRTVGFQLKGDQSLETGRASVVGHLSETGFDMNGLMYADGSGLSRSNKVTPIAQVKYLANIMQTSYYKTYLESLPIGGQTGTLKRMFNSIGNGQFFAKTGTLNKVKTLAGYLKTNSGKTLVFSLMINNYSGSVDQVKNRMEKILEPTLQL